MTALFIEPFHYRTRESAEARARLLDDLDDSWTYRALDAFTPQGCPNCFRERNNRSVATPLWVIAIYDEEQYLVGHVYEGIA